MKLDNGQFTAEAELMIEVRRWLDSQRRCGVRYARIVDRYTRGYSDIFVNVRGRLVLLELKDNVGTSSPHQEAFLKDMVEGGAIGGVCRTLQDVKELVYKALYCDCSAVGTSGKHCSNCGKLLR